MQHAKPVVYEEIPGFRIKAEFSNPELHARVLKSYINVCVDAVPVNFGRKTLYLAKRCIKPQQDWWWIGGAMVAGEIAEEAMSRKFKSETSLKIPAARFKFVCLNRYFWKDRQQEPQDTGCDCLVYTFSIVLSKIELELASKKLDAQEYAATSGLEEFDRDRLVKVNAHKAILDFYDQVFPLSSRTLRLRL